MSKPRALLAINRHWHSSLFSQSDLARLRSVACVLNDHAPVHADKNFLLQHAPTADIIVTSWDTANIDEDVLAAAKHLRLVCHAAGSVRPVVSEALWHRGIRVTSAAAAISCGVAEFCLGLILTASKRTHWLARGVRHGLWMEPSGSFGGLFELHQQNVGVIGAGHIGSHLLRLLKNFSCHLFAYDPFLSREEAVNLGCTKLESLEDLFTRCRVVSLNAPSNEGTCRMLRGRHFAALPLGAVFVNTAGSIQIDEPEFVAELRRGRFVACIDRCEEEPCPLDHPYRTLPNIILTPHIAGAAAENRLRIGTSVVDEISAFAQGRDLAHEITKARLEKLA